MVAERWLWTERDILHRRLGLGDSLLDYCAHEQDDGSQLGSVSMMQLRTVMNLSADRKV